MPKPDPTYTIEDVWIELTYPNGIVEEFQLEAPNGEGAFQFGFRKVPKLPDYRDAYLKWQRGSAFYQLVVYYNYESHEMDLRKLLVASNIALKFPPAFGQTENYQTADVLLGNSSVVKNYLAGLAMAGSSGEIVPSGSISLEFLGVDAFTEAQVIDQFCWNQSCAADPDDEDPNPPEILDDVTADIFVVGGGATGGYTPGSGIGMDFGGGGGAGGCLYRADQTLLKGVLDFYVGQGGKNDLAANFATGGFAVSASGQTASTKVYYDWVRITLDDGTEYYTDFSEYTTGVIPSDWTVLNGDPARWTVEEVAGATGGKVLQFTGDAGSQNVIYWDDVPARGNVKVEARVYSDGKGTNSRIRVLARSSSADFKGYLCELTGTSSFAFRVARVNSSLFTNIVDDANDNSWSASTWYNMEFNISGAPTVDLDCSFWETTEPGSPLLENTHFLESQAAPGGGQKGEDSWINNYIAYGGGRGQEVTNENLQSGGSGGGARNFSGTVTASGGGGEPGQGVNGRPAVSAQKISGSGGGADSVYDDTTFAFNTSTSGDHKGQDFSDLFGPYFAENYGANGAFAGGGVGAFTRSEADDADLDDLTPTAGAGQGFIGDFSGINRFPTSAQEGTGSGGGAGVNSSSGQLDEPGGNGGRGFAMFGVAIADANKVVGNFHDVFDYNGMRWYVLPFDEDDIQPPPPQLYEGSITVTSAAASSDPGVAPTAQILVNNAPSEDSTDCSISGGNKFNIEWEGTDYCTVLSSSANPEAIAVAVAGFISSSIPGLNAVAGTGFDGRPSIDITSTTAGTTDNGKRVIFGVPSAIEADGGVFNKLEVFLSGGEDPTTIDTPVDILLGKLVFATTANVVADESENSIATKIFNAADGVDTADVSVTQDGTTVYFKSQYRLSIALDIGNTGFSYDVSDMEAVGT